MAAPEKGKQQKYYTIIAGPHKPQPVLQGTLQKNGFPSPEATEVLMTVGTIQIPNYSLSWGKRIISNPATEVQKKKNEQGTVQLNDPDYRGEVEWLSWGANGGEAISARWLPTTKSIDKQYQEIVLKLKETEQDALIDLNQGTNEYDYRTDSALIQMLKIHGRNEHSESRNDQITGGDFIEHSISKELSKEKDKQRVTGEAYQTLFKTEGNDDQIAILAATQGMDTQRASDFLFNDLLEKVKLDPVTFYNNYRKALQDVKTLFSEAVELKVLDASQDGILFYFVNNKREVLVKDIPSSYKGAQMANYLVDEYMSKNVYDAIVKLKLAYETYLKKI